MSITILFLQLMAYFFASLSGCFGGQPDIYPRPNTQALASNSMVSITRKDVKAVHWVNRDRQETVAFREEWIGKGKSKSRILYPLQDLSAGTYELHLTEPDEIRSFQVGNKKDKKAPCFKGDLVLESYYRPKPDSECPTNYWIKCQFPIPEDDLTEADAFSYLVYFSKQEKAVLDQADLLVHAERVKVGKVSFRVGESGCGCLPKYQLSPGETYTLSIFVMDRSGKVGKKALYGEVRMPD
ncbi:MAG: hypothetical protein AAFP19_15810 [Bacteroidota bacterium]